MDFMKWLNSLDELLYEVMSWLLFFPLTVWRATVHPLHTMGYVARQAALPEQEQYGSLLSPPLFLALSLLLAHGVSTALGQTDAIIANQDGLAALVSDNASALILRVIIFAAFPLFMAARLVRVRGAALDRSTLRLPFYEQCYPTAVFALALSIGTSLAQTAETGAQRLGTALLVAGLADYVWVEVRWFAAAQARGIVRAIGNVLLAFIQGAAFFFAIGFLFTR